MAWFKKEQYTLLRPPQARDRIPDGLCTKCQKCGIIMLTRDYVENLNVCPKCGYHARLSARERIEMIVDAGTFVETHAGMTSADPLKFVDIRPYPEQIKRYQKKTGLTEAVVTGHGDIHGIRTSMAFMDANFIMASVGSVVGEKISLTFQLSLDEKIPCVIFCAAGGQRMQEGILSLMQMAKTSAMVSKMHEAGLPYISFMTDPTGAGVAASFASLGDLVLAEPGALIYFAGPRVIEQTIRQVLPKGFQRSEFAQEHGFVDMIVERPFIKGTLGSLLAMMTHHESLGLESGATSAS